jgi:transcriptional regulator with XRE-family HTH domain
MEEREVKNQTLGTVVRSRRVSRGMSLADAAAASGLHHSYWSKLENGHYQTPSPRHLQTIAVTLKLPIEDLYGLAGYAVSDKLPTFTPYLRAKYDLPPEAVAELERYFELLRNYYGIPKDQPVFPPKPKDPGSVVGDSSKSRGEDRRAA